MCAAARSAAPLSSAQLQLWMLDRMRPGSPLYAVPTALRLSGPLDEAALRAAATGVLRRHEILRARFRERDGVPEQVVVDLDPASVLPLVDLTGLAPAQHAERLRELVDQDAVRPFDLAAAAPVRMTLVRLGRSDHALLFCAHHIVFDGASFGILFRELGALYRAAQQGRSDPLPPLPLQYAEHAREQRQRPVADSLAYWRTALAGLATDLPLPTDRPRPRTASDRGATLRLAVRPESAAGLEALCARAGLPPFAPALAAFTTVLARVTGHPDVAVGVPVYRRDRPELEKLIGYFVNTAVVRVFLADLRTLGEVVDRTADSLLAAVEHADAPFDDVVRAVAPERASTRVPLVRATAGLIETSLLGRLDLPGVTAVALPTGTGTAKFDLSLDLLAGPDGLVAELEYSTDQFDAGTVERLGTAWQQVLAAVVADPDFPWRGVDLLGPAERDRLLRRWNDTADPGVPVGTVPELFAAQAARTPDAVAVVHERTRLTYRELSERSNRLARALRGCGVRPETPVGVCLRRSVDSVTAVLAVLAAGGAVVPLDDDLPGERLGTMLRDAGAALLVTESELLTRIPDPPPALLLDAPVADTAGPAGPPPGAPLPANLAFLLFTSGSTGRPKCAMLSHANLVNYAHFQRRYGLDRMARVHLQLARFGFDLFIADIMRALFHGAALVLCPREVALDGERLYALMRREEVNVVEFVPALLRLLLDHVEQVGGSLEFLDLLAVGGDVWQVADCLRARRLCGPGTRLIDTYGLTEAAVDNANFDCAELGGRTSGPVPIGRPLANTQLHVLDAGLELMPAGLPGELHVGGAGVGRGYAGQPGLTADRFRPDPFGPPGGRLYRTGDLTRLGAGDVLEILGRTDDQLKIRGVRIEPGEIEAALVAEPGVDQAVVVPQGRGADARLVGYVTGVDPAAGERLRSALAARLPRHLVPSALVVLDALPLNDNGKIDRQALAGRPPAVAATPVVPPRTAAEQAVADVWSEVLGVGVRSVDDDFFELGGHSLLASQVAARLRARLGRDVPLATIFDQPTVAALAAALPDVPGPAADRIRPVPRDGSPLAASAGQRQLWYVRQLYPDGPAHTLLTAYELRGRLDEEALVRAVGTVVARHEALRTVLVADAGELRQVVRPAGAPPVSRVDLTATPDRDAELEILLEREADRVFDLAVGPLFRVTVIRLDPVRHVLAITLHHAVVDAWSIGLLLEELSRAYAAERSGGPVELPALPVQYADVAAWQQRRAAAGQLAAGLAHWTAELAGVPAVSSVPPDRPPTPVPDFRGDSLRFRVPAELVADLTALGAAEAATPYMVLLSGYGVLLARYADQDDLVVGSVVAQREPEAESLIGFFVNTVGIRLAPRGDRSFRDLIRRVRRSALAAYAHQEVPLDRLVRELRPRRRPGRHPLFQTTFSLQNTPPDELRLAGLDGRELDRPERAAEFELGLTAVPRDGGLDCLLAYRTALYDRSTMDRFAADWRAVLAAVAAAPDQPLDTALGALVTVRPSPAAAPPRSARRTGTTPVEPVVEAVWCDALGVTELEPHTTFFRAGGDSLLAVEVTTRISELVGVPVGIRTLFETGTVRALSGWIWEQLDPRRQAELASIVTGSGPD